MLICDLLNKNSISLTELCCLLVAKYHNNVDDYIEMYKYYLTALKKHDEKEVIISINNFLQKNDKKELSKLETVNVMDSLVHALKISEN